MKRLLICFLLVASLVSAQSATYPHPTEQSWLDLLLWSMPRITASTTLPVTTASNTDMWLLVDSAGPVLYVYSDLATTTPGWRQIGGVGGSISSGSDPALAPHIASTGVSVHGLGTMSIATASDYSTTVDVDARIATETANRQAADASVTLLIPTTFGTMASETATNYVGSEGQNISSTALTLALDQSKLGGGGVATQTVIDYIATETANRIASDASNKLVLANYQTATYTLVLADAGKLVRMATASTTTGLQQTIYIPPVASVAWPIGTVVNFSRADVGDVRIAGSVGTTVVINSSVANATTPWLMSRYSGASAVYLSTDTWEIWGAIRNGN